MYSTLEISKEDKEQIKKLRNNKKEKISAIYVEYKYYSAATFTFSSKENKERITITAPIGINLVSEMIRTYK